MMMHNMYPDRLLGFNLIPTDIYTTRGSSLSVVEKRSLFFVAVEEAWYEETSSDYGPVILYKRGWTLTGKCNRDTLPEHLSD